VASGHDADCSWYQQCPTFDKLAMPPGSAYTSVYVGGEEADDAWYLMISLVLVVVVFGVAYVTEPRVKDVAGLVASLVRDGVGFTASLMAQGGGGGGSYDAVAAAEEPVVEPAAGSAGSNSQGRWKQGQRVEYLGSKGKWIATVVKKDAGGDTLDVEVKKRARREKVRAVPSAEQSSLDASLHASLHEPAAAADGAYGTPSSVYT